VKKSLSIVAVTAVMALAAAACASKPTDTAGASTAPSPSASTSASETASASPSASMVGAGKKACMVSDLGGFDDKSFNQTSYKGLQDAVTKIGVTEVKVESNSNADYDKNVTAMISQKCKVIVTVGFLLGDATKKGAKASPGTDFAIVDYDDPEVDKTKNIQPLVFNTAQAAFMGGYLAAAMTKSGVVGTWGGDKFSTVTIFMDGFSEGIDYYNKQKNKTVRLVGWDEKTQAGQFIGGDKAFDDKSRGQVITKNLLSQGADIVMPVAGPAGEGALQAAAASGGKLNAIWVDTDGYVSSPNYQKVIMSSVYKAMDVAVEKAITDSMSGTFSNKAYVGTLGNNGVGLAPFHDFDSKVPADTKAELNTIKADIISGKITIASKAQPTSK
jgi:basic membrane protein A and related proteins